MQTPENLAYEMRLFKLKDLKPLKRIRGDEDKQALRELGESLRIQQYQPLLLGPDLTIHDGNRRWEAGMLVKLESLWGLVRNQLLSPIEELIAQYVMTEQRKGLTEQERVRACEELQAACPDLDQKQLAKSLQTDQAMMSKCLCLKPPRVLPEVRQAFFSGEISLKAAYPISQAPLETQLDLLDIARKGATREQLTTLVRQSRRGTSAPAAAVRVRCPLASGHVVTISGPRMTVDDVIEQLAALMKAARKASQDGLDVKTWERVLVDRAKDA